MRDDTCPPRRGEHAARDAWKAGLEWAWKAGLAAPPPPAKFPEGTEATQTVMMRPDSVQSRAPPSTFSAPTPGHMKMKPKRGAYQQILAVAMLGKRTREHEAAPGRRQPDEKRRVVDRRTRGGERNTGGDV
jgi:hypothetical protein